MGCIPLPSFHRDPPRVKLPEQSIKLVLVGVASAGKTALVQRLVHDSFTVSSSTVGASYETVNLVVDEHSIFLEIWDTAGAERYRSLVPTYYRDASAAIVVFDVSSRDSFTGMKQWIDELLSFAPRHISLALVGAKCDLIAEDPNKRATPSDVVADYALSIPALCIAYTETSAKTGENVEKLFEDVCRAVMERRARNKPATLASHF
ncbi:Rab GTPase [Pelomyxa schiedti]|nr:Rab GTPase [Pelomyxa schiedti]